MSAFQSENLRVLGFASIDTGYDRIGLPFANPIRMVLIQNYTNELLYYSDDGINDKWVLPSGGHIILDIATNRSDNGTLFQAVGKQIYVKHPAAAPTSGSTYVSAFYGYNGMNTGGNL